MGQKDSIFGAEPDRLRQLIRSGMDIEDAEGQDKPASSVRVGGLMERPGTRIGCYKLLRLLGEGGMGMVYLAEQEQLIRRRVALKIIKPGMDSKKVLARFEAERQALALLDHPNIAHVYDAGTTEVGRPYFVMEYVKGLPITEYCDHHKQTIKERLRLFQQVCHAIHHAHQKGIIHRDIKPSNILVSTQDDKAVPKIIDFGVAKAISRPLTEKTLLTEDSQLLGTPEYMSPEQADMAGEDIDTRSDIYSLGVLLYVLLTGALPFDSDTLRTGGIEHIRQIIRETDPKMPSTRLSKLGDDARKVAESRRTKVAMLAKCLHRELEWIPLKAMRKERAERYRSASELSDDIENYLKGSPLIAGPPTAGYRLRKFLRRHKALVGGIAAVLVVSVIGTTVSVVFAVGQARARVEAERQTKISQAVSNFLCNDLLASVDPSKAKGEELTVRSFLDNASANLEDKFKNKPLVEATIRDTLGWTYRMLGEIKAAERHLERSLQIRQEQLGQEHAETLESMGRLGWVYCDQGRYKDAATLLEEGLSISRHAWGDGNAKTLDFANALGCVYRDLGRSNEAEQLYLKNIPIAQRVLGSKNDLSLMMVGNLGQVYEDQGRYVDAETQYNEMLQLREGVWDDENVWTLFYKGCLAGVCAKQNKYEEALRLYNQILPIERRVFGEEHVFTLWSKEGLACVYIGQGNYEQAENLLTEALEGLCKVRGEEHRDTIRCMNHLAELYTACRRFDDAESQLTRALDIGRRTLGEDHPVTLDSKNDLGVLYKEQARYEESEKLLLEAIEGRRLKLGNNHPHTIESLNNLIALYEAWNKPEKAEEWRAKLMQIGAVKE